MANYKDIHGTNIETVASDPSDPVNGQVWYNSATQTLKGFTSNPAGSWSTSGAMNNGRGDVGSAGTQTSAIAIAGGSPPSFDADSEGYNGSSWTEFANVNTARYLGGGAGASSTAALFFGGNTASGVTDIVESFNGTSWTEVGDLNGTKLMPGAAGTQTAAISMGGQRGAANLDETELFNGTAWTEVGNLGQARYQAAAGGPSNTANLCFGGRYRPPGTAVAINESWNGSSWTETTDLNSARFGWQGSGTQTACLGIAGYDNSPAIVGKAELWNGTAWAEQNDLSQGRYGFGASIMSSTASVAFCAPPGAPGRGLTEEWNAPTTATVTFDVS